MTDTPDDANDKPELPEELAQLIAHLGGTGIVEQIRSAIGGGGGPVNWDIARQVALQLAAPGDRPPSTEETTRAVEAQTVAEHWLDEGSLPTPPDAGRLAVTSRQAWVNAALDGLRAVVEPVATASIRALEEFVSEQAGDQLGALPEVDLGASLGPLLRPMGGVLMGLQTGQVIGQLSNQLIGQYDLGIPTAEPSVAYRLPVNATEAFAGYELDAVEVEVVLALHEGAHRRQYHAVSWLTRHVHGLIVAFAEGTTIDADQLLDVSRDLMADVDPDDPESLQKAMEQAAQFRLEPTPAQRRVLERLQGVVLLLQAWARQEVRSAAEERLPNLARVEEVLRRRRATQGAGERMLSGLLGLDLKPDDEEIGDRFLETVRDARGLAGLRRALAHPENLPDAEELADPSRWLVRMAGGEDVPDDASALFDGDAPVEPPGDERGD
jgi:putative hydrolase